MCRSVRVLWLGLGILSCSLAETNSMYGFAVPGLSAPSQQTVSGENPVKGDEELKTGTSLTREGKFLEAIPHLLAARAAEADSYAATVNLGICYVGAGRYKEAISALESLRSTARATAAVENLLAQAYLGDHQLTRAWDSFISASASTPNDEKLYAYVADACNDQREFDFGLRAMSVGLRHLPDSARLRYERGLLLAQLDRLEEARPEFDHAAQLAGDSYIATLALVQLDLYDSKISQATHRLLIALAAGHRDYQTLSLFGTVLMHAGAVPGDAEFAQAQQALEESARTNPEYSATQIALGRIYILEGRFPDAVEHLEIGRRLEPRNPAVYSNLASAYRHTGNEQKAQEMLRQLGRLLAEKQSAGKDVNTRAPN